MYRHWTFGLTIASALALAGCEANQEYDAEPDTTADREIFLEDRVQTGDRGTIPPLPAREPHNTGITGQPTAGGAVDQQRLPYTPSDVPGVGVEATAPDRPIPLEPADLSRD